MDGPRARNSSLGLAEGRLPSTEPESTVTLAACREPILTEIDARGAQVARI